MNKITQSELDSIIQLHWIDSTNVNLSRANLSGVNLSGANFSEANLSEAKT